MGSLWHGSHGFVGSTCRACWLAFACRQAELASVECEPASEADGPKLAQVNRRDALAAMNRLQIDWTLKRLIKLGAPKVSWVHQETRPNDRLAQLVPQAFVLLVLLVSFLDVGTTQRDPRYQVIEYFAGVGRICSLAKSIGLSATGLDLEWDADRNTYGKSCFNINESAGFAFLGEPWSPTFKQNYNIHGSVCCSRRVVRV